MKSEDEPTIEEALLRAEIAALRSALNAAHDAAESAPAVVRLANAARDLGADAVTIHHGNHVSRLSL